MDASDEQCWEKSLLEAARRLIVGVGPYVPLSLLGAEQEVQQLGRKMLSQRQKEEPLSLQRLLEEAADTCKARGHDHIPNIEVWSRKTKFDPILIICFGDPHELSPHDGSIAVPEENPIRNVTMEPPRRERSRSRDERANRRSRDKVQAHKNGTAVDELAPPGAGDGTRLHGDVEDDSRFLRDVDDFIGDNGIDGSAAADFRGCPSDVQKLVMVGGQLKNARNPSASLVFRIKNAWDRCGNVNQVSHPCDGGHNGRPASPVARRGQERSTSIVRRMHGSRHNRSRSRISSHTGRQPEGRHVDGWQAPQEDGWQKGRRRADGWQSTRHEDDRRDGGRQASAPHDWERRGADRSRSRSRRPLWRGEAGADDHREIGGRRLAGRIGTQEVLGLTLTMLVDGETPVPVALALASDSILAGNASWLLQVALGSTSKSTSLFDVLHDDRTICAECMRRRIVQRQCELGIVCARGREHIRAVGTGGNRTMMLALAIAVGLHDGANRDWNELAEYGLKEPFLEVLERSHGLISGHFGGRYDL